ncbi:hypothetical protein [Humidisolicoccus flavus]|uniref:hypothetical protein n=1 Tax=Humidisolicoccus flavus TaxID=3111414 RepID=UPI00324C5818
MSGNTGSSPSKPNVTVWAKNVRQDEPHDLFELEDRLRDRAQPPKTIRPLTIAAILAMISGTTVTWNASEGVRGAGPAVHFFDFDPAFELAVLLLSFLVICVFQISVLRDWFANGRVRDTATLYASGFVTAVSALAVATTVVRAVDTADLAGLALYTSPPILALLIGLVGIVLTTGGRRPAHWRAGWKGPATVNLATLPRASRAPLMKQRNAALRVLQQRGLLDVGDQELEMLSRRPLGRLAR